VVSLTAKFERGPLDRGLKLGWGGFRLCDAISQKRCEKELIGDNSHYQEVTQGLSIGKEMLHQLTVQSFVANIYRGTLAIKQLTNRVFKVRTACTFTWIQSFAKAYLCGLFHQTVYPESSAKLSSAQKCSVVTN